MFTYDKAKRLRNLEVHGFDFIGVGVVFDGNTVTREDRRAAYGELRLQTLGLWRDVVVFVVHTLRGDDDHIISIRRADRHEQRTYWKILSRQGFGPD